MQKFMKAIAAIMLTVAVVCAAGCKKVKQPTVETTQVSNLTMNQVTIGGFITSDGGGEVIERGICWDKVTNPDISANVINAGQGVGSFTCTITSLEPSTTYYVRAYAVNSVGVGYGSQVSFTTLSSGGSGTSENYTISVSALPTEGGTVSGGGTFQQGQQCIVKATSNTGYTFVNWTENDNQVSDSANYTFIVNSNRTLVANFISNASNQNIISVSAAPTEAGIVSGDGSFDSGTLHAVTATANDGYNFTNWTENGNVVSTDANYTFTVNANRTLVANFAANAPNQCTINVSADPNEGGTVGGGGGLTYGQDYTVHATASSGWFFSHWTENGAFLSSQAVYTFKVYGTNRNLVAHFRQQSLVPTSAINGVFSVNASRHVYFSQGNLQYQASTGTWRFAEKQWDYVGTQTPDVHGNYGGTVNGSDNNNISSIYNGWIDLFGWGTSGYPLNNRHYQPWDSDDDLYYGPDGGNNGPDGGRLSDWGIYAISNGGNQAVLWKTLTNYEWDYVFNTRSTSSGIRYAKAQVNNVNGVILVPDNWSSSYYTLYNTNSSTASFSSNVINSSFWLNSLEANGAVFLPAAGHRNGTITTWANASGNYWSFSHTPIGDNTSSYYVHFLNGLCEVSDDPYGGWGAYGKCVRLVCVAD